MNTYQITSQGDPITPYVLTVELDVEASAEYVERVASTLTGEAFDDFFAGYVENAENAMKTHPDFTTQDANRNSTITNVDNLGPDPNDSEKTIYDITYTFTVENAVATFEKSCSTALTGTARDGFFDEKVVEVETDFYLGRPAWTKTN